MTHTIPHYIKSNAKNYPKDIALREKKFGVWKTKDWQQCLEEIENITLGLHAKGIHGKKTIAIVFFPCIPLACNPNVIFSISSKHCCQSLVFQTPNFFSLSAISLG